MNKKLYLITAILIFSFNKNAKAQQHSLYTQYIFNLLTINPAYSGSQNYPIITTLLRQHWAGIRGAPRSASISGHLPFKQTKSSLGGIGYFDNIGPLTSSSLYATYSYKIAVTKKVVAAFGLLFGFDYMGINLTSLTITPDASGNIDSSFSKDFTTGFNPNIGVGIYLSSKKAYLSVSIPTLLNSVVENTESKFVIKNVSHIYTAAGVEINLTHNLKLKPNLMFRLTTSNTPFSLDVNTYFLYKNAFWLGFAYRLSESASAIVNFPILHNIRLGYAYDYPLAIPIGLTLGSHEIFINLSLREKSTSFVNPRNF